MEGIALQLLVNAVIASVFYCLVAMGLTLIYGILHIVNFAHGEFYMLGAYTVWFLYTVSHWPFYAALLMAIVFTGVGGLIVERGLFRRLGGEETQRVINGFLIAVGLAFMIQVVIGQEVGGLVNPLPVVPPFSGAFKFLGAVLPKGRLAVIPAVIILLVALWFFLSRMRIGRAIRAYAQDSEAALLQGVNTGTTSAIAMAVGVALAGAAGALMSPLVSVQPYMGAGIIWKGIVVVVVGGMGNLRGTVVAAILFGFLDSILSYFYDASLASMVLVLVMLIVLTFRPRGLLSHAEG